MKNKFAMKMKRLQTILAGMLMLSCMVPQSVRAQEPVKQSEENMKWFADAKLGIFIHWGENSISGFVKVGGLSSP